MKGFSERNTGRMVAFRREYPCLCPSILPQAVAEIDSIDIAQDVCQMSLQLPWGHNLMLMEKISDGRVCSSMLDERRL